MMQVTGDLSNPLLLLFLLVNSARILNSWAHSYVKIILFAVVVTNWRPLMWYNIKLFGSRGNRILAHRCFELFIGVPIVSLLAERCQRHQRFGILTGWWIEKRVWCCWQGRSQGWEDQLSMNFQQSARCSSNLFIENWILKRFIN